VFETGRLFNRQFGWLRVNQHLRADFVQPREYNVSHQTTGKL
jgi:hypothetical protein